MKHSFLTRLLFFTLLLFPVCKIYSQESKDSILKSTLVDLEKRSWVAWQNHDSAFFRNFLSDDHVEMGFGGSAGKNLVVKMVGSDVCTVKIYSVDRFKLFVFDPHTALLTYHAAQETTCNGAAVPSPVWVSSLYQLRNGKWLNVLYQQTQTNK